MARIREHEWPIGEGGVIADAAECRHCGHVFTGAKRRDLLCIWRDAPDGGGIRPEPARREYASEAWDEIGARITEIAQYEAGYCWIKLGRSSKDCWCMGSREGGGNQSCTAACALPDPAPEAAC